MSTYTQANRPMRVETVLGEDVLLLKAFSGHEALSTPYVYTLELLSTNASIATEDLLRTAVTVTLDVPDGGKRYIHGLVTRFTQAGQTEDLTAYRATIAPWLWFLNLSADCRIFQQQDVFGIVERVFEDLGYHDFVIRYTRSSYPRRDFCVQYRESHLNFVSRLLEEEGLFYFFEHEKDKHTLVIADDNGAIKPSSTQPKARLAPAGGAAEDDVVHTLDREFAVHAGKVTLADYDYLQPSLHLLRSVSGPEQEEIYDYPGSFTDPSDGERLARLQLEAHEALREVVHGTSACRGFETGFRFSLERHYRKELNTSYMFLEIRHRGSVGSYPDGDESFEYANEFTAIPHATPYRPLAQTRRPVVRGSQTAVVVGKSGEDIWVDNHGRVKVQFHWDRVGKKDENSSCWVRVSSGWAGKGWGVIQIPRIGQEVIVDFIEGDPDRPIITGRVYNAEQVPPYSLPDHQTQSGVKSRSTKDGTAGNFNEIRLEDKAGSEELYIHAEKDHNQVTENDRTEDVGNDRSLTVGNNKSESVGKDKTENIGNDKTVTIGSNLTSQVGSNHTETVDKNMSVTVKQNRDVKVGKELSTDVGAGYSLTVGKDSAVSVGQNHGLDAGKKITVQAGDAISIESDKQIVLKTGKASIMMKKNGDIIIKGGKIQIKGSKDIIVKGSKIAEN